MFLLRIWRTIVSHFGIYKLEPPYSLLKAKNYIHQEEPVKNLILVLNQHYIYLLYYPLKKLIFDRMGNKVATNADIAKSEIAEVATTTNDNIEM